MPFKGVDVMDVKKEFVLKSLDKYVNFTELCRGYGNRSHTGSFGIQPKQEAEIQRQ